MKTLQIYALSVGKDCHFNTRILLCLLLRARLLGLNKRKKQKAVFFLNQKQKHVVYFFFPAGGGMPRFECFSALVEYHCPILFKKDIAAAFVSKFTCDIYFLFHI